MTPFMILGATKTATSTAVAVANAHPSVFCLYECDFTQPADDGRNLDLVTFLPGARPLFQQDQTFVQGLHALNEELVAAGWQYEQVGTKVQGIRPDIFAKIGDMPVLFMVRDIRTWAVKNRVISDVIEATPTTNAVPFLVAYASYFLSSFLVERCIRLQFDRLLSPDHTILPRAMADLLSLPQDGFENWWEKAPGWTSTPPKNYSNWVQGHASAFLPPIFSDTRSTLFRHPFWDAYLPIFDKYFLTAEKSYPREEIESDQRALEAIGRTHSMTLDAGFEQFDTFKVRSLSPGEDGKFTLNVAEKITKIQNQAWHVKLWGAQK